MKSDTKLDNFGCKNYDNMPNFFFSSMLFSSEFLSTFSNSKTEK